MKQVLIFATQNPHKAAEIQAALPNDFQVITLQEAGIHTQIPEPFDTLEANAAHKAATIYALTGKNCFSEDTGLEVASLNGDPGVRSARFAGEHATAADNIALLLQKMKGKVQREARFRTIIHLILDGKAYVFEGICNGRITTAPEGEKGFGYDPIFIPEDSDHTFAAMKMEEKNKYSHRRKALDKMITFLQNRQVL